MIYSEPFLYSFIVSLLFSYFIYFFVVVFFFFFLYHHRSSENFMFDFTSFTKESWRRNEFLNMVIYTYLKRVKIPLARQCCNSLLQMKLYSHLCFDKFPKRHFSFSL